MNQPEIDLAQLQKMATVNRQVINRLKERVANLENALALVGDDPQIAWLYRNRAERMDPTVPIFPQGRADFHLARYQFATRFVELKAVADIACGTGYGTRLLKTEGNASEVTGFDLCDEAIQYATDRHATPGVTFVCSDASSTGQAANSLDVIVSFETIEHVPDDQALLNEFARILKPGGTLICSTPNAWPLEIAPHHVREYTRDSFLQVLREKFEVMDLFNQNSGSDFRFNHGQPAGIIPTTDDNQATAECFIAVARKRAVNQDT